MLMDGPLAPNEQAVSAPTACPEKQLCEAELSKPLATSAFGHYVEQNQRSRRVDISQGKVFPKKAGPDS